MFKIGQKVVCIDNSGCQELLKNEIYTVDDLNICPNCGNYSINLNISVIDNRKSRCNRCFNIFEGVKFATYKPERFVSVQYAIISNKEIIKEIIPEKSDLPILKSMDNKCKCMNIK